MNESNEEVSDLFGKLVNNIRLSSDENALGKVLEILHKEDKIESVFKHIHRSARRNDETMKALDWAAYCKNRVRENNDDNYYVDLNLYIYKFLFIIFNFIYFLYYKLL